MPSRRSRSVQQSRTDEPPRVIRLANGTDPPLPDYDQPPVTEVALGVQFESLPGLNTVEVGALWERFARKYPLTEDQPLLSPAIEVPMPDIGRSRIRLQLGEVAAVRSWFLSRDRSRLIQVQRDRLLHNWRRDEGDGLYPRYSALLKSFRSAYTTLDRFVKERELGEIVVQQCEVTYINHIDAGTTWRRHGQAHKLVTPLTGRYSDRWLGEPEQVQLAERHAITDEDGEFIGRLHITLEPVLRLDDRNPAYALTLTARGAPLSAGLKGAVAFLDVGHEQVVRGFTSFTSASMQKEWGRTK